MLRGKASNVSYGKAIAFGLVLIPVNAYWIALVSTIHNSLNVAYASLFIGPVFSLFVLVLLNLLLKWILPRFALKGAELMIIYVMLVMLCTVSGHNPMDFLLGTLVHPFWFATPENEYASLFHRHIPEWFTVRSEGVLRGFFEGDSTLYTERHIKAWLVPILVWSSITFVIFFVLMCINSILRLQWIEKEKLTYPIVQLPVAMIRPGFFSIKLLWVGFGIAALIEIINGLNFLYPTVPRIPLEMPNFGSQIFTTKPWNAIGSLPLYFHPWGIGLTYFVPLDMSFSMWFFFLFTQLQLVIGSIGGWRSLPGFPYYDHQCLGAWVTLGILILWIGKKHLKDVFSKIFSKRSSVDDSKEALGYRTAVIAIIIGMTFLILLFRQAGMSTRIVLTFFAIYSVMAVGITHARAAVGPPYHEMYLVHPQLMLVSVLGTRRVGTVNLTVMSFLLPYVRDHVAHPMPSQLEGFKIAERTGIGNKKMLYAMIAGLFFAIFASFWAYLHLMYKYGAVRSSGYVIGAGEQTFTEILLPWLQFPRDVDSVGLSFTAFASVFTVFLTLVRRRFIWWPFHPAGYAIGMSSGTVWIWSTIFAGWAVKVIIVKFGGLKAYRKAVPLFLGLILGDFVVGSVWSIIGAVLNTPVYKVFQNY